MKRAIKRILSSALAFLFLLTACAPAPAPAATPELLATRDAELVQLRQQVETLSAAQTAQPTQQNLALDELKQQVESMATQQKALSEMLLNPTANPTASPIPLTPTIAASLPSPVAAAACDPSSIPTPTISRVDPEQGETYGGTTITIAGTNLVYSCGDQRITSTILFDDKPAQDVICNSPEFCTLKSPEASDQTKPSSVPIRAINNTIQNQENFQFTYLVPPTVDNVSPNSGSIKGGDTITITGNNFSASGTTFYFGTAEATLIDCAGRVCRVVSPALVNTGNQDVVVWVRALTNGAYSRLDTSSGTKQAFKYKATPRYACDAYLVSPGNQGPYKPGESFTIEWVVKNIGTSTWPAGQDVRYSGGTNMVGGVSAKEIGKALAPNDTATITLDAKAPQRKGQHFMTWIVAGQGCSLYVAIKVE